VLIEVKWVKVLITLEKNIRKEIKDYFGVSAKVKCAAPKTDQRSEVKAKRIEDKRKLLTHQFYSLIFRDPR
jgi:phenylacetate-CoA ligase